MGKIAKCSTIPEDLPHIKAAIRRALREDPHRKEHGYFTKSGRSRDTSYTAFWIEEPTCAIHVYREFSPTPIHSFGGVPATSVHSHIVDKQTMNAEDIKIWQRMAAEGRSTANIVIFPQSNDTFDILGMNKREENREKLTNFLKLTPSKIKKELRTKGGYHDQQIRSKVRAFAKKYGLTYITKESYRK